MGLTFTEKEKLEADGFQKRLELRRAGKYKPKPLKKRKFVAPSETRLLIIGDSHAHPDVENHRYTALGRMIRDRTPDVVVDIGDSADMPSLMHFDKARPTAIFEGFTALWRDVEAYYDAQDRLMNEIGRGKHVPKLLKTQGNHEFRIQKAVDNEPRLRGFIDPSILREREYGWTVTPYDRLLTVNRVGFRHNLPGGSSKTGPRGVVTAKPGTAGVYCYGHTHRRGVHYYAGLKPNKGAILNVGCFFDVKAPSHSWAGDDVDNWCAGIQEITVDGHGYLRSETWTDYATVLARYMK